MSEHRHANGDRFQGERRHNTNRPPRGKKMSFTQDFDFDEQNQRFSKETVEDEVPESSQHSADEFYNRKTSFFDNISSSAKEQVEGTNNSDTPQQRRGEERKLNLETFGIAGVHHRGRGRGRGGRGFRGGRGGRGRGRGGRGGSTDFSRADGMSA